MGNGMINNEAYVRNRNFVTRFRKGFFMTLKNINIKYIFEYKLFFLFNIVCLLNIVIGDFAMGVPCAILIIISILINGRCLGILSKDKLYAAYIFFCLISVALYIYSQRSIVVFIASISYNFIPSLLYLVGADVAKKDNKRIAINSMFNTCVFIMGFGLFFYLFMSDFYYDYIGQPLETYTWGIKDYRFGSYLTSLIIGSLCVACFPMFMHTIKDRSKIWNAVSISFIMLSLVLCMQRAAWYATAVMIFGAFLLNKAKLSLKVKYFLCVLFFFIFLFIFRKIIFTESQINMFISRISNISFTKMAGSRALQWKRAINAFTRFPIGYGLGAYGTKAGNYGYECIYDGNYFRILVELGLFGMTLFMSLLIRAIYRAYKRKKIYIALLLFGFALHAIGTNVFDLFFCSFVFWFMLGYASYTKKGIN